MIGGLAIAEGAFQQNSYKAPALCKNILRTPNGKGLSYEEIV